MAKSSVILLCLLIIVIDVSAGILGIQAEVAQNKVKHLKVLIFECKDPSIKAFMLGLAAAVLLALAHALANLLGGCVCDSSWQDLWGSSANKLLAVAALIISWIILLVGFFMLIIGAMANSKSRIYCGISYHGFLSIGGILCFVHGAFALAYYLSATAAAGEEQQSAGHA